MIHPFQKIRKQYLAAILALAVAHYLYLVYPAGIEPLPAVMDSLVYNLLNSFFAFGYWYIIKFGLRETKDYTRIILTHFLSMVVILSLIIKTSNVLLRTLFNENENYLNFLNTSLNWRITAEVLFFLIIGVFYYITIYYMEMDEQKSREQALESLVKDAELNALKSQINPHFIFNSLNSINALIHTSPDKASDMLVKLSQFLRFSIRKGERDLSLLKEELENAQRYLSIEKIRFDERLHIEQSFEDECLECRLPALILQPLLENSIKYGVYESLEPSVVALSGRMAGKDLEISITNRINGGQRNTGAGIGLKNVRERLRLLYEKEGLLKVTKENDTFTVTLLIPQL